MGQTLPVDPFAGNPVPYGRSPSPDQPGVFRLKGKDGNVYPIRANSIDEAASALDEIEGKAPKSAANRFVHGVADQLNPITALKAVGGAIAHPVDTAKALVDAQSQRAIKAYDLAKEGRYSEAAGNAGAAVLPLLGPMAADIGEQAGSGDIAGAAGRITGLALIPRVAGNSATMAGQVARPLGVGIARIAPVVGQVAKELAPEAAGAVAGAVVSGPIGGMVGGAMGRAVKNAVIKIIRKQRNLSESEATKIADSISAEQGQKIISRPGDLLAMDQLPPQAQIPVGEAQPSAVSGTYSGRMAVPAAPEAAPAAAQAPAPAPAGSQVHPGTGLPLNPDGTVTVGIGKDAFNIDPARLQPKIAPIPPNKLPPVLPDPVIPEKIPTSDIVEAKPAFKGQQSAKGATNARFAADAERIAINWMKNGKTDSFIKGKLVDMFKMSADDAAELIRKVSK